MTDSKGIWAFLKEFVWTLVNLFSTTRNVRMKYCAILFVIALASVYLFVSDPPNPVHDPNAPHFTICIFHLATGYPCPGCGTTRAMKLLFHGMPYQSLMMNPFGIVAAVFMLVTTVWIVYDFIAGRQTYIKLYQKRPHWLFFVFLIVINLANWYWNLLKGL